MKRITALITLALTIAPLGAMAQTWRGTVKDIRTGEVIADASVCAGRLGRVDVTCMQSGADGTFSVTYPEDTTPGEDNLYYLYVDSPAGGLYYNQKRARTFPGEAEVQLVPINIYIKGRLVDAVTNTPISGVEVSLRQPGRYDQSLISDGQGLFAFEPVFGFENSRDQYNTYGVPEEDLPPDSDGELVYDVWGVEAPSGQGLDLYAQITPQKTGNDRYSPELDLLSSATPEIFTWVELRLPPAGTEISDPGSYYTSQIGEPDGDNDTGVDAGTGGDNDTGVDTGTGNGDGDGFDADPNTELGDDNDSSSLDCTIVTPGNASSFSLFKLLLALP